MYRGGVTGIAQLPFSSSTGGEAGPARFSPAPPTIRRSATGTRLITPSISIGLKRRWTAPGRCVERRRGDLEDLVEGFSENDREALASFVSAFDELMDDWDSFHVEFDGWVRTEGDCNRAGAASALQLYNQRFSEIGSRVRGLTQVSYLRPSSDLLSEAVEREGAAIRSLANTWAPYESDVYRGMDEERANADKLRRPGGPQSPGTY